MPVRIFIFSKAATKKMIFGFCLLFRNTTNFKEHLSVAASDFS